VHWFSLVGDVHWSNILNKGLSIKDVRTQGGGDVDMGVGSGGKGAVPPPGFSYMVQI